MPARRSTSRRARATSSFSRQPIPSSPAWRRHRRAAAADAPSLRLANLLQLGHPMSVDLYVEQVVSRARLVILRLLGGRSYWPYGLEQVAGACRAGGIPLAVAAGRRQSRCRAVGLEHASGRGAPSAVAVRRAWRPRQCAAAARLCGNAARPRRAVARTCTPAARRAVLAGARAAGPGGDPRPLAGRPAGRGPGVLSRPGAGGRPRRDRRPDRGVGGDGAQPPADLRRKPARRAGGAAGARADRGDRSGRAAERHGLRRLEPRRASRLAARRGGSHGAAGRAGGRQPRGLAGGHARPVATRSGDERGAARGRRPRLLARGRVQEREQVRRADRGESRELRAGGRPDRLRRRAGRGLGAARAHAGRLAPDRARARQLPQPRRPDRERRRARHAGQHRAAAARAAARRAIGSRICRRTAPR